MPSLIWFRFVFGSAVATAGVVLFFVSLLKRDELKHTYLHALLALGLVVAGLAYGPGGGEFDISSKGIKGKAESVAELIATISSAPSPSQL